MNNLIFPFALAAAFLVVVLYMFLKTRIEANDLKKKIKRWNEEPGYDFDEADNYK